MAPGTLSSTALVTNLANRVQPVIRYDLGDRVRFQPGPCGCGSRLPALAVEGRTDDTLVFAVDSRSVTVLPLALGTVVEETPGVHRFQIVRSAPACLTVRLEAEPGADAGAVWREVERRLGGWLRGQGLTGVELVHDRGPLRTEPRSGKLRQVVSTYRPDLSEPCGRHSAAGL